MSRAVNESYDYIIAGGGSAGCVLARRLSDEDYDRILEALIERRVQAVAFLSQS